MTVMSGVGGGITSLACSYLHRPNGNKFDLGYLMNGILGGLVGITGTYKPHHPALLSMYAFLFCFVIIVRSAGNTIMSSVGGGVVGLAGSWLTKKRQFDISYLINGVLGGLVACTGDLSFSLSLSPHILSSSSSLSSPSSVCT